MPPLIGTRHAFTQLIAIAVSAHQEVHAWCISFSPPSPLPILAPSLSPTAGAMRLPNRPGDRNKVHFLTAYYTEELFKLELVDFVNSNDNTFLKFYNYPITQKKGKFCS